MTHKKEIIRAVLKHFPEVQAIYLFGSYGSEDEWPESDVDIAVLLPVKQSMQTAQPLPAPATRRA